MRFIVSLVLLVIICNVAHAQFTLSKLRQSTSGTPSVSVEIVGSGVFTGNLLRYSTPNDPMPVVVATTTRTGSGALSTNLPLLVTDGGKRVYYAWDVSDGTTTRRTSNYIDGAGGIVYGVPSPVVFPLPDTSPLTIQPGHPASLTVLAVADSLWASLHGSFTADMAAAGVTLNFARNDEAGRGFSHFLPSATLTGVNISSHDPTKTCFAYGRDELLALPAGSDGRRWALVNLGVNGAGQDPAIINPQIDALIAGYHAVGIDVMIQPYTLRTSENNIANTAWQEAVISYINGLDDAGAIYPDGRRVVVGSEDYRNWSAIYQETVFTDGVHPNTGTALGNLTARAMLSVAAPEPSVLALLLPGVFGATCWWRGRRSQKFYRFPTA
jgi:hypothetical protein